MAFLAVDVDPTEGAERIRQYQQDNAYPWPMAPGDPDMTVRYGVRVQSTKIAVDQAGVIVYKRGYGVGSQEEWRMLLDELVAGTESP